MRWTHRQYSAIGSKLQSVYTHLTVIARSLAHNWQCNTANQVNNRNLLETIGVSIIVV